MWHMIKLLIICLFFPISNVSCSENIHLPQLQEFSMIEKSAPKWITEGQIIELTCKTNKPWNICRWTLPNGKNCDDNKVNLYEVACQYDSRIKFMKKKFEPLMNTGRVLSEHHKKYIEDLNSQCTIQIIGTKLSDHGIWKCLAHDDPFKGLQHTETSISVNVVTPYILEMKDNLSETGLIQSIINETIKEEVICISKGQSQVKPTISWIGNGILIDSAYVTEWIESSPGFDFEIYQAVIINKSLLVDVLNVNVSDPDATLDLNCYSTQVYPNGTIFYESSKNKIFGIRREDSDENSKSSLNIPGTVISIIIALMLLVAIFLIFYAQKKNKWCYESDTKIRRTPENSPPPIVESIVTRPISNGTIEETTHFVIEESSPTTDENNMEPNNEISATRELSASESSFSTLEDNSQLGGASYLRIDLVGDAPIVQETMATPMIEKSTESSLSINLDDDPTKNGFLHQNDSDRLLELINSPPPSMVSSEKLEDSSGFRISLPSLDSGRPLSTHLTTPIRSINRNSNQYVKSREQISTPLVVNRLDSVASSIDIDEPEAGGNIQTLDVEVHRSSSLVPNETAL